MRDLMQLLREDTETQTRVASYGLDPVRIEQYLAEREWHVVDPTADEAVYRADRDLAKKRKRAKR